jgi:hypothetical protein
VSDDDVPDFIALLAAECDSNAAGVDGHAIIDEKTSQALFQSGNTLVVKSTW